MEIRARIAAAANRLGLADPTPTLDYILRRTFAHPAGDPSYRTNRLQPGALPLEWSFSEADPDALRIEFQPFEADLAPEERLRRALIALLPAVEAGHGAESAAQFRVAVERDAGQRHASLTFGAFVGLVMRQERAPEFKLYVEIPPGDTDIWRAVIPDVDDVIPHMRSVAVSDGVVAERTYHLCRQGFRLLDLEAICTDLAMPHQFPPLLLVLLELSEGEFYLPPRSVLLGIRRNAGGAELKVELIAGLAIGPTGLIRRIERLLHPTSVVPFRRWSEMVRPQVPPLRVVSVRVTPTRGPQLSVYASEQGCES